MIRKIQTFSKTQSHVDVPNSASMILQPSERWQSISNWSSRQSWTDRESIPYMNDIKYKDGIGISTDLSEHPEVFYPHPFKCQEWIDSTGREQILWKFLVSLCNGNITLKHMNTKHLFRFSASWLIKKMEIKKLVWDFTCYSISNN